MKPTVPEVLPLVQTIYARHCAGCCLHIVLDDGNVDDDEVQFCLDRAVTAGHADCQRCAELLVRMSKTQRLKLHHTPRR